MNATDYLAVYFGVLYGPDLNGFDMFSNKK